MKKNLALNLNVSITTDCWNFIRLSIIQTNEEYTPWFIENFIDLFMSYRFEIFYHNWDVYRLIIYDEILHTESIENLKDVNIIQTIIDNINNNKYVMVLIDNYFIKQTPHFQKNHFIHDILACGYDKDKQEISYLGIDINNKFWSIQTIQFSDLEKAFSSAIQLFNNKKISENIDARLGGHPLSVFYKKPFKRSLNIYRVYHLMIKYIYGGIIRSFANISNEYKTFNEYRGSSVYFGIKELLAKFEIFNKLANDQILFGLKRLIEHKHGLFFRVKYLMENNFIEYNNNILSKIEELPGMAKNLFLLITRFIHSDKRVSTEMIYNMVNNLKDHELNTLSMVTKSIEDRINL